MRLLSCRLIKNPNKEYVCDYCKKRIAQPHLRLTVLHGHKIGTCRYHIDSCLDSAIYADKLPVASCHIPFFLLQECSIEQKRMRRALAASKHAKSARRIQFLCSFAMGLTFAIVIAILAGLMVDDPLCISWLNP